MFEVTKSQTYLWPVSVSFPGEDGEQKTEEFRGQFRRVSASRISEIVELQGPSVETILDEIFLGWLDVSADGKPLEVTPENRAMLLDFPGMRAAITRAWFESITGQAARRKN